MRLEWGKTTDGDNMYTDLPVLWHVQKNHLGAAHVVCASSPSFSLREVCSMEFKKAGNDEQMLEIQKKQVI